MNNSVSTNSPWMTLNDQVKYMCRFTFPTLTSAPILRLQWNNKYHSLTDNTPLSVGVSAAVVIISTSLAFSQTARTALSLTNLPLVIVAEHLGLVPFWRTRAVNPLLKMRKTGDATRRRVATSRKLRLEKEIESLRNEERSDLLGEEQDPRKTANGGEPRWRRSGFATTLRLHQKRAKDIENGK